MENFLIYFLKANIALAIGFILYRLLVANQRWFQLNRFLLIIIGLIAFISPLLHPFSAFQNNALFKISLPEFVLNQNLKTSTFTIDWFSVLATGYFFISALILIRLVSQIIGLLRFGKGEKLGKYLIIDSNRIETSSFFNRIFLKDSLDGPTKEIALTHEKVHADQWHTIDVIWFELLTIIFWVNPAVWLLKKELRDTHEYIADARTKVHFGSHDYLNAILNHAFNSQSIHFIPKFSNAQTLKNRIIMMKSNHPVKRMRYAIFLPLLAAISIASANTGIGREIPEIASFENERMQEIYSVVDQMPEFPGGQTALFEFLSTNLKYPESAQKEEIEGKVFVSFVISDAGEVKDVKIMRGVHADIDKEAARVVSSMPNWTPGVHKGKKVNVSYNLPIVFKLSSKE